MNLKKVILYNNFNVVSEVFYVDENDNKQGLYEIYTNFQYEIWNCKDNMFDGKYELWEKRNLRNLNINEIDPSLIIYKKFNTETNDFISLNVNTQDIQDNWDHSILIYIKIEEYNYKNGMKNGEFKIWKNLNDDKHCLCEIGNYIDNKLDGIYKKYNYYNDDGDIIEKKINKGKLELCSLWRYKHENFSFKTVDDLTDFELIEQQEYKDSLKNGEYKEWYLEYYEGKKILKSVANFKDGLLCGESKEWYKDGFIESITNYTTINDKDDVNDVYLDISDCYSQRTYKTVLHGKDITYWRNGFVKHQCEYIKHSKEGEELQYYENGNLAVRQYWKNGHMDGKNEYFYKDGKISSIKIYKEGEIIKSTKYFRTSDQLESEDILCCVKNYKDRKYHGEVKRWWRNKKLRFDFTFKFGVKNGKQFTYDELGILVKEEEYINGKIISRSGIDNSFVPQYYDLDYSLSDYSDGEDFLNCENDESESEESDTENVPDIRHDQDSNETESDEEEIENNRVYRNRWLDAAECDDLEKEEFEKNKKQIDDSFNKMIDYIYDQQTDNKTEFSEQEYINIMNLLKKLKEKIDDKEVYIELN
jgi:antitoxin component YwqK of YwqJK toxin-antitoxin module